MIQILERLRVTFKTLSEALSSNSSKPKFDGSISIQYSDILGEKVHFPVVSVLYSVDIGGRLYDYFDIYFFLRKNELIVSYRNFYCYLNR